MNEREGVGAGTHTTSRPFGCVISCRGSEIRIGLPMPASLGEQRATVGKFVAIDGRSSLLVGIIVEINAELTLAATSAYRAIARVDLLGEIVRDGAGGPSFRRGVRNYPAIGDEVAVIDREDLRLVYSSADSRLIAVGDLHQDSTIPACVDADSLLAKHFAVLGSTGVGKSSGVAVMLEGLLNARPDVRILLLDVHNEYSRTFGDVATVIGSDNLKLPFWLFNFEEMTDVIYCGKPSVPEEVEILAELIPLAKRAYLNYKSGADRPALARRSPRDFGLTADTPSPYLIQDLLGLIDERMGKLENRSSRMAHHRLMMRIEAIRNDPRYGFMFENANVGGDTMAAVLNQLFRLDSSERGITVLKLASLPGEAIDAAVCTIARLAFEFGVWSDGGIPLLLMCEEAHRYASADHSLGFAPARRALSRIAKEGRKYSVSLGLVTQRPAELDPTILSQCSTLFVMRMANEDDHSILQSAASEAAANLLSFVPSLATGEVVGLGEGMPLPARFTFKTLQSELIPCSESGSQLADPARGLSRTEFVNKAIERWRRATTNQMHVAEGSARGEAGGGPEEEGQNALVRGLNAVVGERQSLAMRSKLLDPERYTILKR